MSLIGLDIISGISGGELGAAIRNEGTLILQDTRVLKNPLFGSGEYLIRNGADAEIFIFGDCTIEME